MLIPKKLHFKHNYVHIKHCYLLLLLSASSFIYFYYLPFLIQTSHCSKSNISEILLLSYCVLAQEFTMMPFDSGSKPNLSP